MEIKTGNLLLRQWRADDFEFYASFFGDESTARYYGGTMNRQQAWRHLASVIGHWELRGFGVWAVERTVDEELIGCAGFWEPQGWPATELAFWFVADAYETGHALDAVRAVRERSSEYPAISRLVSYVAPDNAQARRLVEAAGGNFIGTIDLFDFGAHSEYAF